MLHMFSDQANPAPKLLYIWIGPPSNQGMGVPGHDIDGPVKMALYNKTNPIFYCCLEAFRPIYEQELQKHGIRVFSIENMLKEHESGPLKKYVTLYRRMMEVCLYQEGRDTVRDRVLCKDFASLLLSYIIGNVYFLDTNVLPKEPLPIALPAHEQFYLPALSRTPSGPDAIDCWMIYTPERYHAILSMLMDFNETWLKAEEIHAREGFSENHDKALMKAMLPSIFKHAVPSGFWFPELTQGRAYALISEYNLLKNYYNTHTPNNQAEYNPSEALLRQKFIEYSNAHTDAVTLPTHAKNVIFSYWCDPEQKDEYVKFFRPKPKGYEFNALFSAIIHNDTSKLETQLSLGASINQQLRHPQLLDETPLLCAIRLNKPDCVELLLQRKADTQLSAQYPFGLYNAYSLAVKEDPQWQGTCRKLLAEHLKIAIPKLADMEEDVFSLDEDDHPSIK